LLRRSGPDRRGRRSVPDAGRDEPLPEDGRHHIPPGRGHEPPANQQARLPPGSRAEVRRRILLRDRGRGPRVVIVRYAEERINRPRPSELASPSSTIVSPRRYTARGKQASIPSNGVHPHLYRTRFAVTVSIFRGSTTRRSPSRPTSIVPFAIPKMSAGDRSGGFTFPRAPSGFDESRNRWWGVTSHVAPAGTELSASRQVTWATCTLAPPRMRARVVMAASSATFGRAASWPRRSLAFCLVNFPGSSAWTTTSFGCASAARRISSSRGTVTSRFPVDSAM